MALAQAAATLDRPPSQFHRGQFEDLARRMQQRLDPLSSAVLGRYDDRLEVSVEPSSVGRAQAAQLIRDALRAQLRDFRHGALPARCPRSAVEGVRAVLPLRRLDLLLTGYRIAHEVLWEAWFDLVERSRLAGPLRRQLLQSGSEFFFRYEALLSDFTAAEFQSRLEREPASVEQRRFHAIQDLLSGDPRSAGSLDFELDRHHLGLIAWGEDPEGAVRAIAKLLARPLLAVSPLEREPACWAWISGVRPLGPEDKRALRAFAPHGARIAFGLEASGEKGFRATHRQALRARRFAAESGPPLVHYADIAIEALAAENEEDARAFVANELRGIEDDSATSRRIRETLEAYFAAEYNAACTGATLGIHQQTVANRLRAAEERLGQPSIRARRVELEMALRLRATLPPQQS